MKPARGLDPAGATVRVEGAGYDPSVGVYLAMCVDQGPALPPSPCFGGADTSGESRSAVWFSNSPPPYAVGLTRPFGVGGSFEAELEIAALQRDETGAVVIDCLDPSARCVIATRADHTRPADRSADVKVRVSFAGQEDPDPGVDDPPSPAPPTLELDRLQVTPGEPLSVSGRGFLAGEQVELLLYSTPRWVSTPVADPTGAIAVSFTVPVDLEPGEHHLEARGVSSGLTARSPSFMVVPATLARAHRRRTSVEARWRGPRQSTTRRGPPRPC
ncbi:hypothetical protein [Rhabdothermincola sediminis]|uniref:hypothetical protein n=1 Tax=Rhabdothermincola sediminis TaxID=2751370 RepID=UPI001AA0421B|nr:hypothetical protein [Rhabdothermincola sediminis]